jgi:hypothetical protein
MAAAPGERSRPRLLRADRGGCRLGRRRAADDRDPPWRLLRAERRQALHHQCARGRPVHDLRRAPRRRREIENLGLRRRPRRAGLRIGKVIPMAGGAFHSEIVFENLSVLRENRLGREGEGFAIAMQCLDAGRINWAAYCVGAAQQLLDASVAHVKAWRQFAPGARFAPSGFWKAPRKSYAISLRATCCAIRRART